jgi:hypothetical protein
MKSDLGDGRVNVLTAYFRYHCFIFLKKPQKEKFGYSMTQGIQPVMFLPTNYAIQFTFTLSNNK